jgi:UDP-N-acetylmuramoyl-tripeptide--D-alanyl-D-alanine ligase
MSPSRVKRWGGARPFGRDVDAIRLTAAWVNTAVSGAIVSGDPSTEFHGVSIDTRTMAAGDLFVAIHGERFDGADFAAAAIAAGAAGLIMPQRRPSAGGPARGTPPVVIAVDDTTAALQSLANRVRRESGTKVVAITGSAGKTTTKEVTGEFLATRYRVIRNRGNLNNHIGLPLSLLELRHRPDVAVVELGMNHAGEISTLVRIAEPEIRVWTNVGEAHVGFFESVDAIADAKAEVFEGAAPSTVLVANADDHRVADRTRKFAGRVTTFGIEREADVRATAVVDRGVDGIGAHVATNRGAIDLTMPLVGRANLSNVLAATAVALELDVPLTAIAERAAQLRPAAHRGEVIRLRRGVTVIDDSYNANPTATRRAIEVLASASAARRIAVLGEMLELGEHAGELHADVGRAAAQAGVDVLVAIGGPPAERLAAAAVAAGMASDRVRYYATSDAAAVAVADVVGPGDTVLVKGSRGVRTERVVERLKAEQG